jgi:hypothetical protein
MDVAHELFQWRALPLVRRPTSRALKEEWGTPTSPPSLCRRRSSVHQVTRS